MPLQPAGNLPAQAVARPQWTPICRVDNNASGCFARCLLQTGPTVSDGSDSRCPSAKNHGADRKNGGSPLHRWSLRTVTGQQMVGVFQNALQAPGHVILMAIFLPCPELHSTMISARDRHRMCGSSHSSRPEPAHAETPAAREAIVAMRQRSGTGSSPVQCG